VPAPRPHAVRHSADITAITNRRFATTLPIMPSWKRVSPALCYEGTLQAAMRPIMRAFATESAI
jgi:hypothetical protein